MFSELVYWVGLNGVEGWMVIYLFLDGWGYFIILVIV